MTDYTTLGILGSIVFITLVFFCLRTALRWGEETRQREEDYLKAQQVTAVDEHGRVISLIRDPSVAPTEYVAGKS